MTVRSFACALIPCAPLALLACGSMNGLVPTSGSRPQAAERVAERAPAAATAASAPVPQSVFADPPSGPPAVRSAVVSSSYSIDGLLLPTMRGQRLAETRGDARRTEALQSFDNRLLRAMAGEGRSAEIVRLDKKLWWTLNPAKHTYTECPLAGCRKPAAPAPDASPGQPQPSGPPREPSCALSLARNDLKVTPTGERKRLNGFNTERIQIQWTLELEDRQQRRNIHRVGMDLWTTPESGVVKEAQAVNSAFDKRWASMLTKADQPFGAYLPPEVKGAMAGLLSRLAGKNNKSTAAWSAELSKLRGFPIATSLSWNVEGQACGELAGTAAGSGGAGSAENASAALGGVMSSVSGMVGGLMAGKPSARDSALVTYTHEVTRIDMRPVNDAWYAPDADYQKLP